MSALLEVAGLDVSYGAVSALRGIDMEVRQGEIVAVIGANGAGKSTLLKTIAGLVAPAAGSIVFAGEPIGGGPAGEGGGEGGTPPPPGRGAVRGEAGFRKPHPGFFSPPPPGGARAGPG